MREPWELDFDQARRIVAAWLIASADPKWLLIRRLAVR
jgi:hypothetical protein